MTVGDVIQGLATASNTGIIFTPASGVQCMISTITGYLTNDAWICTTDGTLQSTRSFMTQGAGDPNNFDGMKLFITNAQYFQIVAHGLSGYPVLGFTGIQIK
tara:strand:- start:48 stop:353 length:306 start_codon:yes stop_codon:yes gene_type:complete